MYIHSHTVFYDSGFKRTLCGSTWSSLTGSNSFLYGLGSSQSTSSTARLGCCPSGSYMSNPELNPFVEANACSTCPSNQFATTSNNDDLSCCATVADGTCTACTSAVASGCTAVTCTSGKFDSNGNVADGCESAFACATVTGGTCTACTTATASGCTAVTCNGGKSNGDNDATNGCETVVQCTKALNGKVCQNGGTITGTVAANNCQCQCTQHLEGPNCEKCPSGMYLLNQNCVACGEGNDYSCPSGEFKSGTVCSGKFFASFGCCFFDLHVCFHCLLCLPYLTQVMVPPIHRRAWFVVTVGPLGCVPLVFRKVGLRAMVPRRKINKVVLWQLRLLPPMNRSIQLQHRPLRFQHRPLWFQHRPLRFQHRPLRFQHRPLRFQKQTTWCTTTFLCKAFLRPRSMAIH